MDQTYRLAFTFPLQRGKGRRIMLVVPPVPGFLVGGRVRFSYTGTTRKESGRVGCDVRLVLGWVLPIRVVMEKYRFSHHS